MTYKTAITGEFKKTCKNRAIKKGLASDYTIPKVTNEARTRVLMEQKTPGE
jgi:hypothetical protein